MVPWLVVVLGLCVRMSLRRLECKSVSLAMIGGVPLSFCRAWGQVLSPPTGGSASVKIMSGVLCPSATLRAVVFASSLCVTPMCDFTLPMCVLYPMLSLVCIMLSASCRRFLWGWWMKLRGSMAYLLIVFMLNALSVNIERL